MRKITFLICFVLLCLSKANAQEPKFVLREAGVQMESREEEQTLQSDILQGKSIVVSGVFSHHSRDEYKAMIEAHGGKNVGSVSKKTSFILAGENMGPEKRKKAESLGVEILTEEQFLELIKN